MRHFLMVVLLHTALMASAQTGNYFLSHYSPGKEHFENACFDIVQDDRGVMYFATKSGILEFDGRNWDILRGQSAVYALDKNNQGEIYWAGVKGFGQITYDTDGFQHLFFLSDSTVSDVFQTLALEKEVYFLQENALHIYNTGTKVSQKIKAPEGLYFSGLFELFGAIYLNSNKGIYKLDGKNFNPSKLKITGEVVFASRIDNDYVIGTSEDSLFVCDQNLNVKPVKIHDQEYLTASVIINGSWINRQLLALGTLRGGIMFVNPITGVTEEIINYETGLPDNEIFTLATDYNKDVWVAHDYGFTRVSPYLPLRSFSHYQGLSGNLLCAFSAEGSVYVGTSLGLFSLQKEDVYDELVYYVDVPLIEKKTSVAAKEQEESKSENPEETQPKKKGIFNFLKRNRNKDKQAETKSGAANETVVKGSPVEETKYRKEKRTKKILRASQNIYKQVNGVDSKITMLLQMQGSLIAGGLGGIYEIQGLNSKSILEEPVRYMYVSPQHNLLFVATYNNEIKALTKTNGQWQFINFLQDVNDQFDYIFEDEAAEMWICGLDNIYQLAIENQKVKSINKIHIPNPDVETTLGITWKGKIVFTNGSGFYTYDKATKKSIKIDSLQAPKKYFASEGHIFYRDDHGWNVLGEEAKQSNLQLLNLFPDLRHITTDQNPGNFWMISGSNDLFKFYSERLGMDETSFPVFLKSVTNEDIKFGAKSHILLSEDKSSVSFEIVQPDFISPDALEFRYQIKGMNEGWSEWSTKNTISFPYLPPGEYTLLVQSKNVFGKITELNPTKFDVLPPYWKRSWFYAMEFAVLASLVLLSHRLNTRYRIVGRILSLLTIILLIQFIQTFIEDSVAFGEESPVIHFIIQVFVALLILPVEGFLRNLMFGSLGSGFIGKLFQKHEEVIEHHEADFIPVDEDKTSD